MTVDLFGNLAQEAEAAPEPLAAGAVLLRGWALAASGALLAAIKEVSAHAPFRTMTTPGGHRMSAAMTNCGAAGWVSDLRGYRYDARDPLTHTRWPPMPPVFRELAAGAAAKADFAGFCPDACLINRYEPGARLSLHQDRNERDLGEPIVSVSLGLPAVFLFGGHARAQRARRVPLAHGDVVVWGGPARLNYHGTLPLKEGEHRVLGRCRINLTLRRAL